MFTTIQRSLIAALMLGITTLGFISSGLISSANAAELIPITQAQKAPLLNQRLPDMKGGEMALADLQGKVVMVDFWEIGRASCRERV